MMVGLAQLVVYQDALEPWQITLQFVQAKEHVQHLILVHVILDGVVVTVVLLVAALVLHQMLPMFVLEMVHVFNLMYVFATQIGKEQHALLPCALVF